MKTLLSFMLGPSLLGIMATAAEIPATTSVMSMLQVIPQCAVPCVMHDLFEEGGCPLTTAGQLAQCACTNITIQSHLSACVQKSCGFIEQVNITSFAGTLCSAYPKPSRSSELGAIAITTIVLSVTLLILRLYSRWLKSRRLWSDDAFAIIAAIFLIAVSAVILQMSLMGFGLHYWDVPPANGVDLLKMFYVCQMLYILVQVFSKVAILALYLRLFPSSVRWFQWSVRIMIAFMFTHGAVFFLLVTFQCLPISSIWDKTLSGKCLPVAAAIGFTGAGLSIVEDFIILLLPIRELWKLQMDTRKKVGLILLLSVGSFASITSIVRLKYVLKYANTYDATWDNVDVIKWSLIEILSACICGNLMPLRPLIERVIPSVRSVLSRHSRSSRSSRPSREKGYHHAQRSWRAPFKRLASTPKLISSFNFTQMSLNPGWESKTQAEMSTQHRTTAHNSLTPPARTYHYRPQGQYECQIEACRDAPQNMMKKMPATVLKPSRETTTSSNDRKWSMNSPQSSTLDSEGRTSDGSTNDFIAPPDRREERHSAPWSFALRAIYGK